MTSNAIYRLIKVLNTPLVAAAIHDGHHLRQEVADIMALDETGRLREEDPFTGQWAAIVDTRVVVRTSRFEMDLNRLREKAVYVEPEDAWGLQIWQTKPTPEIIARSLAQYDAFYQEIHQLFTGLSQRFGRFVVLDLHTYNHRRDGPDALPADPAFNPEVNLGTGTMDRRKWAPVVERFTADLRQFDYMGRHLDVRENVRFRGGNLARWTHQNFPDSACVLAVEVKKFFMDEWTGQPEIAQLEAIRLALHSTVPGILEVLQ